MLLRGTGPVDSGCGSTGQCRAKIRAEAAVGRGVWTVRLYGTGTRGLWTLGAAPRGGAEAAVGLGLWAMGAAPQDIET